MCLTNVHEYETYCCTAIVFCTRVVCFATCNCLVDMLRPHLGIISFSNLLPYNNLKVWLSIKNISLNTTKNMHAISQIENNSLESKEDYLKVRAEAGWVEHVSFLHLTLTALLLRQVVFGIGLGNRTAAWFLKPTYILNTKKHLELLPPTCSHLFYCYQMLIITKIAVNLIGQMFSTRI